MEKICSRNAPHLLAASQAKGDGFFVLLSSGGHGLTGGPVWPEGSSVRTRRQEYLGVVSRGANRLGQGSNSIHYKGEMNMLNILTLNMPGHDMAVWAEEDRE